MADNKVVTTKHSVGESQKQTMGRRMVPEVVTGEEVGEWLEAGRRGVPVSVLSKQY